jgi:hypothetical protein
MAHDRYRAGANARQDAFHACHAVQQHRHSVAWAHAQVRQVACQSFGACRQLGVGHFAAVVGEGDARSAGARTQKVG